MSLVNLINSNVAKCTLLLTLFTSVGLSAQELGVFDELLARENIVGRWEGDKPTCLLSLFEMFADSRNGEIDIRRDGHVLGLPTEVKWAVKTMMWDGIPRLTLVLWIKDGKKYTECVEAIDVSRKTLRFINRTGVTYCRMQKAD